jgi:hypothetical protein
MTTQRIPTVTDAEFAFGLPNIPPPPSPLATPEDRTHWRQIAETVINNGFGANPTLVLRDNQAHMPDVIRFVTAMIGATTADKQIDDIATWMGWIFQHVQPDAQIKVMT